ncbi:hypothetical protein M5D96_005886 [Drosophila gunungcola]|uniref:Uncharacterized protein n=1 Tax=Drosophila gunungcola TaxID=103775 RepID=A0A9P9YR90_9MUSC|nr:hypothetical protein M5D96_005886 [Drosophila gunungcola]
MDQRMSTFEPYQIMRDPVQQFCEKNFNSIKSYMDEVSQHLPPPTRCSIEGKSLEVLLPQSLTPFPHHPPHKYTHTPHTNTSHSFQ